MGARPGVSVGPAWCGDVAWCECGEGAKPGVWAWPGVNLVCGRGLMRVCVYMAWFGRGVWEWPGVVVALFGAVWGRGLVWVWAWPGVSVAMDRR